MTKWIALPAACVAAAALAVTVEAAPKTSAQSTAPKTTKTTTKAPSTTTTAKGSSTKTKPASPKSTSAKADHAGGSKAKAPKSTTSTAKGNGSSKKASTTTTASTSTDSNTPSGTTTTTWQPTNAVAEKLMTKPNQLAKLKAVLPAGTDINDATAGFKNFGQLNAAVNVSQNLGIDFADLKASMTGITIDGDKTNQPTKSLGQAIQQFKPGVDADAEAAAATTQASKEAGQ
jgi:hypothetical protein